MPGSNANAIAVLRIELEDIEPLIWRRVAAPTSMSLKDLHGVIQAVMGWRDCHLWEFVTQGRKYGLRISNDPDWNQRISNAVTIKLSSLGTDGVKDMTYVYDMGDNWQHRIIVEKLTPAEPDTRYPQFLGGERRCPPEDCGGVPGYYGFLDNISSKQTKKRKAALDWYGGPYDPNDIDEDRIVATLGRLARGRHSDQSKAVKT
jgi:Plasmid pRiA4b ORF-3-like protein